MTEIFNLKTKVYTKQKGKEYFCVAIPSKISHKYENKEVIMYESGNGFIVVKKEMLDVQTI